MPHRPSAASHVLAGLAFLLPALAALPASAQSADAPEPPVAAYQRNLLTGCKQVARMRGATREQTDGYCGCVLQTLKAKVSDNEWQQAAAFFERHDEEHEAKVLDAPSRGLDACRSR